MSAENVAIVKSSWAGWRQKLAEQMTRDFEPGVAERIEAWSQAEGRPELQPEDFIDQGDVVLVRARPDGTDRTLWFRYELAGRRIGGWSVHEDEDAARTG